MYQNIGPSCVVIMWPLLADFDLDGLRSTLDEKGLAIAATQDQSLKSRKQLAESTKGAYKLHRPVCLTDYVEHRFVLVPVSAYAPICLHVVEFKKSVGSDVFRIVSPLLKKYQEEVDALTQRSKLAESAFLDVFARLQEAPDPGPSLGASLVGFFYLNTCRTPINCIIMHSCYLFSVLEHQ